MKKSEKYATGGIVTALKVGYLQQLHPGYVFPFSDRADAFLKYVDKMKQNGFFDDKIAEWDSSVIYGSGYEVNYNGIHYISTDECNKPNAESNINKTPGEMDNNFWRKGEE